RPVVRTGRYRRRAGPRDGGGPRAVAGLRGGRDREAQPRPQLVVHSAQDLSRRRGRARVSDAQPGHRRHQGEAPRGRAPREALLPARAQRQVRPHQRKGLTPGGQAGTAAAAGSAARAAPRRNSVKTVTAWRALLGAAARAGALAVAAAAGAASAGCSGLIGSMAADTLSAAILEQE